MFNWLTLLVGNPLGDLLALDSLLGLASGDGNHLGLFHWGVGADLLGHLTAVRFDSHLTGGLGNSLNLDCWSSMDGSTIASSIDSCTMSNSSSVSTITMAGLSLPLVDAIAQFP